MYFAHIVILSLCVFGFISAYRYWYYYRKIIDTHSLIELKRLKERIQSDIFILLYKREIINRVRFWHEQIVSKSLFESGIDLDEFLEPGQNITGNTNSEDKGE